MSSIAAVLVKLKVAAVTTPDALAETLYDPVVPFAVNTGEVAFPAASVVAVPTLVPRERSTRASRGRGKCDEYTAQRRTIVRHVRDQRCGESSIHGSALRSSAHSRDEFGDGIIGECEIGRSRRSRRSSSYRIGAGRIVCGKCGSRRPAVRVCDYDGRITAAERSAGARQGRCKSNQ